MLENVRIVLVNTTHPGNIGAAARAMKTMGLKQLDLVKPECFPSAECTARASGADDILADTRVFENLQEAIADCGSVFATSARSRRIAWPEVTPDVAATEIIAQRYHGANTAIVFGRESSGLSNEDMDLCQTMIRIPTDVNFSSLNIASAVQIICYELIRQYNSKNNNAECSDTAMDFATAEQMEMLYEHFQQALAETGYFDPENPRRLMRRIRRLFNRARLDDDEYRMLRGILTATQNAVAKNKK